MPNTFITPSVIATRGLATLYNNTILGALVWRDFDADFAGVVGDTITIRKPAVFEATTFDQTARTTTWQDATEGSVALKLDTIRHVPFLVTDEQMTLNISDFQEQLLNPAMEAIVQGIDGDIAEGLIDAAEGSGGGGTITQGAEAPNWPFRKAREKLTRAKMPLLDRHTALSPEATTEVLGDELLVAVDKSGATDALREAIVGRVFGFETYETQALGLGSGDAGQADGVAWHRSAYVLAVRPLQQPRGIAKENYAVRNFKGMSLRVIYSYNHSAKQDQVTVDIMYGRKATRPEGIVQLDFGHGS